MINHRTAIDLAATAIDFALADDDRARLDDHLRSCASCRSAASAFHGQAAALAALPPIQPPTWVRSSIILPRGPRRSVLLLAAAVALVAMAGVTLALGTILQDRATPEPSGRPAPTTGLSSGAPPSAAISPSSSPSPSAAAAPGPIARTARFPATGSSLRIGPAPDGSTWIVVEQEVASDEGPPSVTTVALIDADGVARPGWPIAYEGWTCLDWLDPHELAVADDGSLRLVCAQDPSQEAPEAPRRHVALALDVDADPLPGWPVELPGIEVHHPPVAAGNDLRVLVLEVESTEGSTRPEIPAAAWLLDISARGEITTGQRYDVPDVAGDDFYLATDGVAYRLDRTEGEGGRVIETAVDSFDLGGHRTGWPVRIVGSASAPTVNGDGRLLFVRGPAPGEEALSQLIAIDPVGGTSSGISLELPVTPMEDYSGPPGDRPMAPVVAPDGSISFIGRDASGQIAYVVDEQGVASSTRLDMPIQTMGRCTGLDQGCGVWTTATAADRDGTLYVAESAVGEGGGLASSGGGTLVAIARDGSTRPGWPVNLTEPMAGYWVLMARDDGTVDAIAVDDFGSTLTRFEADGTQRSSTRIIGD